MSCDHRNRRGEPGYDISARHSFTGGDIAPNIAAAPRLDPGRSRPRLSTGRSQPPLGVLSSPTRPADERTSLPDQCAPLVCSPKSDDTPGAPIEPRLINNIGNQSTTDNAPKDRVIRLTIRPAPRHRSPTRRRQPPPFARYANSTRHSGSARPCLATFNRLAATANPKRRVRAAGSDYGVHSMTDSMSSAMPLPVIAHVARDSMSCR